MQISAEFLNLKDAKMLFLLFFCGGLYFPSFSQLSPLTDSISERNGKISAASVLRVSALQFDFKEFFQNAVYRTGYVRQLGRIEMRLSPILPADQVYNSTRLFVENETITFIR